MRLAVLGAFPFPYPQGSQIYAGQQATALAQNGADLCLMNYGRGAGDSTVPHQTIPKLLAPRRHHSGPHWGKPVADAALLFHYLRQHRKEPFDLALAHNAEAAMIGIIARRFIHVPVLYVAHTLMQKELSAYGPPSWSPACDRIGTTIDSALARNADGIIVLSPEAEQVLLPHARGPIRVIPPGLDPSASPSEAEQAHACKRHGLEPSQFTLYSGNLDRYQNLELLRAASKQIADPSHPIVVATHDARGTAVLAGTRSTATRIVQVDRFEEMRALLWAAHTLVMTRQRAGGFPIKLLNYMEAGKPIVAFESIGVGLQHDHSAWLLPSRAGSSELAHALLSLRRDSGRAARLGVAARRRLETHHAWQNLAEETLTLAREITEISRPGTAHAQPRGLEE